MHNMLPSRRRLYLYLSSVGCSAMLRRTLERTSAAAVLCGADESSAKASCCASVGFSSSGSRHTVKLHKGTALLCLSALDVCLRDSPCQLDTDLEQCMRLLSQPKLAGRQIFASLELTAGRGGEVSPQRLACDEHVAVVEWDADSSERVVLVQKLQLQLSARSKSLMSHSRKRADFVVMHGVTVAPALFLNTAYLTTATELLSLPLECLWLGFEELFQL